MEENESPAAKVPGVKPAEERKKTLSQLWETMLNPVGTIEVAGSVPVFSTVYEITIVSPGATGPTSKLTVPVAGRLGVIPVMCVYDGPLEIERLVNSRVRVPAPRATVPVTAEVKAAYPTPVEISNDIANRESATLRLIMNHTPKKVDRGREFAPCPSASIVLISLRASVSAD